jgi:hypothetical protein
MVLDISYNNLQGSLPDPWGQCSNLTTLQLNNNALTGESMTMHGFYHDVTFMASMV